MDAAAEPKPLRTWRPMILWSAGIVLALGLAWFVGAVAVPYYQVRAVVWQITNPRGVVDDLSGSVPPPEVRYIERLGGSKRARAKLQLYLRLPKGLTNRGEAAYLLGWCGRSAVPTLIRLLGDQDDYVRVQSAQALAHLGPEAEVAVPALMTTLSDPQPGVRSSAAQALGTIGPAAREAAPLLMQILKGPMPYERQAAAFALGRIGDARAVGPLQGLLTEADWSGRWIAARALGDLGPSAKEAIPALEMLLSDREERVRLIAAEALKKIKGEEPPK